jgi:hypothetical protein
LVVHAGMAAAVPAAVAGLTRPEIADLRCGGAAAGAAVALGRLEQWGRPTEPNPTEPTVPPLFRLGSRPHCSSQHSATAAPAAALLRRKSALSGRVRPAIGAGIAASIPACTPKPSKISQKAISASKRCFAAAAAQRQPAWLGGCWRRAAHRFCPVRPPEGCPASHSPPLPPAAGPAATGDGQSAANRALASRYSTAPAPQRHRPASHRHRRRKPPPAAAAAVPSQRKSNLERK